MNRARKYAIERFAKASAEDDRVPLIYRNADMSSKHLNKFCRLEGGARDVMEQAYSRLGLSARGYDRLLRVARTIADLDESDTIEVKHIAEAIQLRSLDRKYW